MKLLIVILFTITGVYAQFTQFPSAPAPAPSGTILTTKGGILSSNGSADVELSVGTDGQVLIADSAEATGLRWGTAGAHTHSITGDNETAPNALTVNIFIRIN